MLWMAATARLDSCYTPFLSTDWNLFNSLMSHSAKVDQYAVMGNPIAHSQSPGIHAQFAKQTGESLAYEAILVGIDHFAQAVDDFQQSGGCGLNITVPFKQQAWSLAQVRSERAELAGAVNTLMYQEGQWFGDNTDGVGLVNDLVQNHQIKLQGKKILVLGAGGAARGVLAPLLAQQPDVVMIANRTASKARELATLFSNHGNIKGMGFDELPEQPFDCIINATAASLQGEVPPIPVACIGAQTCAYDMMYAAHATAFLQWAQKNGAQSCIDGLGMLVEQAAESFYIWRHVRPQTEPVITYLREKMLSSLEG